MATAQPLLALVGAPSGPELPAFTAGLEPKFTQWRGDNGEVRRGGARLSSGNESTQPGARHLHRVAIRVPTTPPSYPGGLPRFGTTSDPRVVRRCNYGAAANRGR